MKLNIFKILFASILASIEGVCYQIFYESALNCDFSKMINPVSISMASTIGCLLIGLGYLIMDKFKIKKYQGWYFLSINILSIISIIGPMSSHLPFDIQNPELFIGLTAPLHLFPILSYVTLSTFFKNEQLSIQA